VLDLADTTPSSRSTADAGPRARICEPSACTSERRAADDQAIGVGRGEDFVGVSRCLGPAAPATRGRCRSWCRARA
jgi:hypothetical protein